MSHPSPGEDQFISLLIEGALDLGRVRQHVRLFLAGVEETVVADAVLVTVMLASDAYRYGDPPLTLRLRLAADGSDRVLHIEVDHQPDRTVAAAADSRAGILDRITRARGVCGSDDRTTEWAEIPLPSVIAGLAGHSPAM